MKKRLHFEQNQIKNLTTISQGTNVQFHLKFGHERRNSMNLNLRSYRFQRQDWMYKSRRLLT